jgi:hypothetical protein
LNSVKRRSKKNCFIPVNLHNGRPYSTADLKHEILYITETSRWTVTAVAAADRKNICTTVDINVLSNTDIN